MEITQSPFKILTKLQDELDKQPRLQWMLLAVFILVLFIVGIKLTDILDSSKEELLSSISMHERLHKVKITEFSDEQVREQEDLKDALLKSLPSASSQSAAEAAGLSLLEISLKNIVTRNRFNLLGSEEISLPNANFWSVRIEINGRLPEENVVKLLENFSPSDNHKRISSMQYSPKASNTLIMVVDLLFREQ